MFIDELTLSISAGNGGDGVVLWIHEKGKDHAGPGGGDGGRGGDVYLKGVRDIGKLNSYRFLKEFHAENGQSGMGDRMHGAKGADLILEMPLGTVLTNTETGKSVEVLSEEPFLFLSGGWGGYGNDHFKSSTNIRPKEQTNGKPGQSGIFFIELKLIVDIGLVGFPNVGKSTLLNNLTRANAKVGNYQFTTLVPNLGDLYGFIIADIPGLIEGAAEGRGLGHKFLRHIARTKAILHCISAEESDPVVAYETIRAELSRYDQNLLSKPEIILFTKADNVSPETLASHKKKLSGRAIDVLSVSVLDEASLKELQDTLVKILRTL